jgi:hypothetical protein
MLNKVFANMPSTIALPLDHTVINVHFDMDRAQAVFESLGFFLTARGRHSLGSINHLIVLEDDYVELVGLPTDTDVLRQEVLDSPIGIDGLVFQTKDAGKTFAKLQKAKLAVQPVQAFSRPVQLAGATFDASFRTTRFTAGTYEAGRVYFCQHLTPELVWRQEWQSHANDVTRTIGFLIVSNSPSRDAKKYSLASDGTVKQGSHGEFRIQASAYELVFITPRQYRDCFGELACSGGKRKSFFGAIALQTQNIDAVRQRLVLTQGRFPEVAWTQQGNRITVNIPYFNALLDFIQS